MTLSIIGIDIAKLKFDLCLLRDQEKFEHKVFPNTPSSFLQLSAWLAKQKVTHLHACLEATGTYAEALATYLSDSGHQVSLVNPAATKACSKAQLSRTKTDKVDAELIAHFCLIQRPPLWASATPEVRELQALVRRLDALIELHTMEQNRLSSGVSTTKSETPWRDSSAIWKSRSSGLKS